MGKKLSKRDQQTVLERAIRRLDRGDDLPREWVQRTEHIGDSPSKTMVAALGSALLARATYGDEIDPLSIKTRSGPRGYSMRNPVDVLAKNARSWGYDIGVSGPEPMNNQPFGRADRVDRIPQEDVRANARPYMVALRTYLKELDALGAGEAESALSAFIATRREVAEAKLAAARVRLRATASQSLPRVAQIGQSFLLSDSEEGRRGQALAAAALDCTFPRVELGSINDPDAFDVIAFKEDEADAPSPLSRSSRSRSGKTQLSCSRNQLPTLGPQRRCWWRSRRTSRRSASSRSRTKSRIWGSSCSS